MDKLELVKAFTSPVATIIAAVTAAGITWVFNSRQLQIAKDQMRIADGQRNIAAAKFNFDLYDKRYATFDAARRLLIAAVQHDHVDAEQVIIFKIETAEAVFLFDHDIAAYLAGLQDKISRFRSLKAQEKAADDYNEEEKRQRLVDLSSEQHQLLNNELAIIVDKFKPYLQFGNL
jgi:hypothetical protein